MGTKLSGGATALHAMTHGEEYRVYVITKDFRDYDTLARLHFTLRHLKSSGPIDDEEEPGLVAPERKWLVYYPLAALMLDWKLRLFWGSPSGGPPIDDHEKRRLTVGGALCGQVIATG